MKNRYDRREPKVYPTESGRWRVRFFDEDVGSYRSKTVRTKTEAELMKRALLRREGLEKWFPNPRGVVMDKLTFEALSEKWLEHAEHVRRISASCLHTYRSQLKHHILPVFGHVIADRLTIGDIEKLARELNQKKPQTESYKAVRKNRCVEEYDANSDCLAISYQREVLTVACMIMKWAESRRPAYIYDNPFAAFKLPAAPEHLYDYWKLEDEDQFFRWIESGGHYEHETTRYHHLGRAKSVIKLQIRNPQELRDIVLVALRTGMRLGEIGALRNMDVDLNAGFIIVRGSYCRKEGVRKNTTKSKKARRVEINADVREILHRRRFKPQKELLFNINMNSIKFFSRTCRWAGIKEIHFHSLRHTCLTNLANGYGMRKPLPLPKVQQIAGHSDIKTTMRYVHGDIINETASLQWSLEERRRMAEGAEEGSLRFPNGAPKGAPGNDVCDAHNVEPVDGNDNAIDAVGVDGVVETSPIETVTPIRKGLRLVHSPK